jgi:hypothetical protein
MARAATELLTRVSSRRGCVSVTAANDNVRLPDPTDLRPAVLTFAAPTQGTDTLQFAPDTATVSTSNLLVGQNDEGWLPLSISPADSGNAAAEPVDLFVKTGSLAGYDLDGTFATEQLTTEVGRDTPIRVCGHAQRAYPHVARVLIYDGGPGGT